MHWGNKLPQIEELFNRLCCMLTVTPSGSEASSDEETNNECSVCKKHKSSLIQFSNLSEEIISFIYESCPDLNKFPNNSFICKKDLLRFQLLIKGRRNNPTDQQRKQYEQLKELYKRSHQDFCEYCQTSLLLSSNDPENDGITAEVTEIKEYQEHRHLSSKDGIVITQSRDFVRFALRCKHRLTNKKPTICCCLCTVCHRVIHRKFMASKEGKYFTPSVKGNMNQKSSMKCLLPNCSNQVERQMHANIDTLFSVFKFHSEESCVSLCSTHRNEYRNVIFRDDRCIFCTKLLKYDSKSSKMTPAENMKKKFRDTIENKNLEVETPENFVTKQYVIHRSCWKTMQKKVREEPGNTSDKMPVGTVPSKSKKRRLSFGHDQSTTVLQEDDVPEEACDISIEDDIEENQIIVTEVEETVYTKSEIKEKADINSVRYIEEYLGQHKFMTRRQIIEYWNDQSQTLAFMNGYQPHEIQQIRGDFISMLCLDIW